MDTEARHSVILYHVTTIVEVVEVICSNKGHLFHDSLDELSSSHVAIVLALAGALGSQVPRLQMIE
jgi:hypothetical protein